MDSYEYPDIKEFWYQNIKLWAEKSDFCVLPITDSANFGIWFNLTGFENYMVMKTFRRDYLNSARCMELWLSSTIEHPFFYNTVFIENEKRFSVENRFYRS